MKAEHLERDLVATKQGRAAEEILASLEPHLTAERLRIEREVFAKIATGALTPEVAHSAWLELHAAHRLVSSLGRKAKRGRSASRRIAPMMDGRLKDA